MKTGTNSQTTEEWKLAQMLQFGNIYTQTISSNPFSRNYPKRVCEIVYIRIPISIALKASRTRELDK